MANPSVFAKAIEVTLDEYRKHNHRNPLVDVSIWHSVKYWYDDEDYVFTSTPEEIFDRLIADNYHINFGEYFFGIDFETLDDKVLEYILNNQFATDVSDKTLCANCQKWAVNDCPDCQELEDEQAVSNEPPVCTCEVKPCLCEDEWFAAQASR